MQVHRHNAHRDCQECGSRGYTREIEVRGRPNALVLCTRCADDLAQLLSSSLAVAFP